MKWWQNTIAGMFGIPTLDEVVMYVNQQLNATTDFSSYSTAAQKLNAVFSNPAMLKIVSLQCDMFSLGKIYVYKGEKEQQDDPFLEMIKKPNPFQRQSQFLWDFMFWQMVGNTYSYVDSRIVGIDNKLYFLTPDKLDLEALNPYKDKIVLSKSLEATIDKVQVKYTYADGSIVYFPWGQIIHIPDLTNGVGNWFSGQSKIDALYKIISNSEAAMDSLNINLRYAGKFMVAGQADPDNVTQLPMSEIEKNDIETKMNGRKNVHAVKSMIDIKRFVENIGNLKLNESQLDQYFLIGSMYQIPKDVLEMYNSGTYENQEKARGAHVSYCLQPKGNLWFESFAEHFGYDRDGREIIIDWEHLPFMQVFAKDRAETNKLTSETVLNYMDAGVGMDKINELLDLDLTELDYEGRAKSKRVQTGQAQGESSTDTKK